MNKKNKDTTSLICDIGELSGLFTDSTSLDTFLGKVVDMIGEHMHSEVCSIYLFNEDTKELVLSATKGLNQDFIGNVKLKLGEGLTGLALKELLPINERHASKNPNFRFFSGLGEEKFESFMAVPIIRGNTRIGVLVIQNVERNYFSEQDETALRAITSQIANTIEFAQFIMSFDLKESAPKEVKLDENLKLIKGKVGSEGFAISTATVLSNDKGFEFFQRYKNLKEYSLEDFHKAVDLTEKHLEKLQEEIEEKLSDVASLIFSAQILMLKDTHFIEAIEKLIKEGFNPPDAIISVGESFVGRFENLENAYLRERAQDVRDVVKNLIFHLLGEDQDTLDCDNAIVIARDLFPTDALKCSSKGVKGIILLSGGITSHFCLLAQSLQIPLIIAENEQLLALPQHTVILMDAELGNIYIDPTDDIIEPFRNKEDAKSKVARLKKTVTKETKTKDGTKVSLMANINLLGDCAIAQDFKAEGVGLYRTEFPFMIRSDFPTEEEQVVIYRKLIQSVGDKEITFRTLDIGGDKVLSYFPQHSKEKNPSLGMRSIRFSLGHVDIFSQQIKAILRAGDKARIRVMFPMISSMDEFLEAKKVVSKCIEEMKKNKISFNSKPQIGVMIELPSVLEIIDDLAREADFFSIGTNDFIQYMLAVDRTNEKVADFYLPYHPSVLRGIKRIADAAQKHKKDISICGDMAHEKIYLPYFLGIGVRKLSVNPNYLPEIQSAIKEIDINQAQNFTSKLLNQSSLSDIKQLLEIQD